MTLWSYPSLTKVQELQGAHDERILGSAVSPDGCTVVTGAADENLKVGPTITCLCRLQDHAEGSLLSLVLVSRP